MKIYHCIKCQEKLVIGKNWSLASKKQYMHVCKPCVSRRGQEWYRRHRESVLQRDKQRRDANPDYEYRRHQTWYELNKEKHKEWGKRYYQEQRKTIEGKAKMMLTWIRTRAKRTKMDFDLDLPFILEAFKFGKCAVTGIDIDFEEISRSEYRMGPFGPSFDRIDSRKGYTKDNCRLVVWCFNMAKQQWTDEIVITMAKALLATNRR